MGLEIVLSMAGGLGLFLYGMRAMSDSIEKVAGARLRQILEQLTTNRFTGILVGIIFTAVIQSSSACTVMVVSFVNTGLMNLYQAAGVIFGANIGTTVTSLLVSFKLEKLAPVILLVGVILVMFFKKNKANRFGEVIVAFGILFMGLSGMSGAMSGMKDSQAVMDLFASLRLPILGVLIGTLLTSIIQSSSVTVSIMVLMANQGLIGLDMCMFIILGCNIGACTPALLASLAGKKDAKRAAAIHLIFNIIGTIIVYILFRLGVRYFVDALSFVAKNDAGRIVAYAHISIKLFQVIIMAPFIGGIVKLTYVFVPGDDRSISYRESHQLKYIGEKVVFNPATAVVEVIKELDRMASLAIENLNRAMNALITMDEEEIDEVYAVEENIDFLSHAISNYMVKINQTTLPIEDLKSIGALFHVVNDIERIGDHAENIAEAAKRRLETGVVFSKEAQMEIGAMLDMVNTLLRFSLEMFVKSSDEHSEDVNNLDEAINEKTKELQQKHLNRLTNNECSPEAGVMFSDIISGLERVADHAMNIAFATVAMDT
ncbi:MAG: Na/Pi cotransporter family protein [Butyrivibrio sp.]|nr:Na/Pi cotransporter family protein [Butyrivibrio sp.]